MSWRGCSATCRTTGCGTRSGRTPNEASWPSPKPATGRSAPRRSAGGSFQRPTTPSARSSCSMRLRRRRSGRPSNWSWTRGCPAGRPPPGSTRSASPHATVTVGTTSACAGSSSARTSPGSGCFGRQTARSRSAAPRSSRPSGWPNFERHWPPPQGSDTRSGSTRYRAGSSLPAACRSTGSTATTSATGTTAATSAVTTTPSSTARASAATANGSTLTGWRRRSGPRCPRCSPTPTGCSSWHRSTSTCAAASCARRPARSAASTVASPRPSASAPTSRWPPPRPDPRPSPTPSPRSTATSRRLSRCESGPARGHGPTPSAPRWSGTCGGSPRSRVNDSTPRRQSGCGKCSTRWTSACRSCGRGFAADGAGTLRTCASRACYRSATFTKWLVPGADDSDDAERPVVDPGRVVLGQQGGLDPAAGQHLAGAAGRPVEVVGDQDHLHQRVHQRLAVLLVDQLAELVGALHDQGLERLEAAPPAVGAQAGPPGGRLPGALDRRSHLFGTVDGEGADHLAGGRAGGGEGLAAGYLWLLGDGHGVAPSEDRRVPAR